MIYQIAYWSKAALPMSQNELNKLQTTSQINNQNKGITGLLLYANHTFFQLIEGPYQAVAELYQIIAQDQRHYDLTLIGQWTTPQRQFTNWDMVLKQLPPPADYPGFQHLTHWRDNELTKNKDALRRLLISYSNLSDLKLDKMM
ncbi:BLUF domain-containing protein [Catenovulum sp. 2E275]|uniref:BLUF domain-containing protein n=1 Tax=Catenovulum sp. 2E275 TaxID=2980497 RepID=UPI0021D224CF|nr:BLUF domain-containing protein [Catenovulum sp. 2E275]MCU4674803.1 BLUF domain-containing protein [Catenovulum sp. 2E275]